MPKGPYKEVPITRDELSKLYESGLSLREIGNLLGYKPNRIHYFMVCYGISRRKSSEYQVWNKNPNKNPRVKSPKTIQVCKSCSKSKLVGVSSGLCLSCAMHNVWAKKRVLHRLKIRLLSSKIVRKSRCPFCGNEAISPHHIVSRAEGGSDRSANLIKLCLLCHDKYEGRHITPNMIRIERLKLKDCG